MTKRDEDIDRLAYKLVSCLSEVSIIDCIQDEEDAEAIIKAVLSESKLIPGVVA